MLNSRACRPSSAGPRPRPGSYFCRLERLRFKSETGRTTRHPGRIRSRQQAPAASTPPSVSAEEAARAVRALFDLAPSFELAAARLEALGFRPTRLVAVSRASPWVALRGDFSYTFTYARLAHGIPVGAEGFRVAVDGERGEIAELAVNWDRNLRLPPPPGLLTPPQAERIFRERVGLSVRYVRRPSPSLSPAAPADYVPVYWPPLDPMGTASPAVDAASGRVTDLFGRPVDWRGTAGPSAPTRAPGEGGVTDTVYGAAYRAGPGEPLAAGPRARDAAVAWAARLVVPPADLRLAEATFVADPEGRMPGRPTWRIVWRSTRKAGALTSVEAVVDAATGDLISYFAVEAPSPGPRRAKPAAVTAAEAAGRAAAFLARARPSPRGLVLRVSSPDGAGYRDVYTFLYLGTAHGLPLADRQCQVNVRALTGRVLSATCPTDPLPAIPPPPRLIPRPEAEEAYLARVGLALWYVPVPAGAGGAAPTYRPAYVPGGFGLPPRWLDARTGEILDEFLLTPPEAAEAASADARGHPLEREVRVAASLGLLPPRDGRSRPDETVTRGELLAALSRFNRTLEEMYGELTVRAGGPQALPPVPRPISVPGPEEAGDPAAPVSREELAALALRALGYDGLLGADPAYFSLPFPDAGQASPAARPALAVAASLGILGARDGLLRPAEPLTRGEAAAALLRLRALFAAP